MYLKYSQNVIPNVQISIYGKLKYPFNVISTDIVSYI